MRLVPFLIAAFLLINPLLDWIFQKLQRQTEKLQFWVMLTSGTAWILGLVFYFLKPDFRLDPVWKAGAELLPGLAFSWDWISAGLILSVAGLVFVYTLTRGDEPSSNAWLAGVGGVCVIGLGANSPYTLGLIWTILEGFHFFSSRDSRVDSRPREYLPALLLRITTPGVLILLSLIRVGAGSSSSISDLGPNSGMVLILAGLIGFSGWFLQPQNQEQPDMVPERWVPAALGLMLIIRGGEVASVGSPQLAFPLFLSLLLVMIVLIGLLVDQLESTWYLASGLLAGISGFISGPETALSWVAVMMLPGLQIWRWRNHPRASLIPLILAGIGVLPIPFFPTWAGVSASGKGIPGYLLGLSYGLLLGGGLISVLSRWGSDQEIDDYSPLLGIIGAGAILVSQVVIAFRLDLISASRNLLAKPAGIWISLLGLVPVLLLGNHLPLKKGESWAALGAGLKKRLGNILVGIVHFLDRLVGLISRLFEGQAGLVWALLIGLLIITLISLRGGG